MNIKWNDVHSPDYNNGDASEGSLQQFASILIQTEHVGDTKNRHFILTILFHWITET